MDFELDDELRDLVNDPGSVAAAMTAEMDGPPPSEPIGPLPELAEIDECGFWLVKAPAAA